MARDPPAPPPHATPPAPARPPLVLDASALLSGKRPALERGLVIPGPVLAEVEKRGRDHRAVLYLIEAGLVVRDPSPAALARVRAAAKATGDAMRLSEVDVAVVAVALDTGGTVATDDYSIQNVARTLAVPYEGVDKRGITDVFRWRLRCIGCRKTFETQVPDCDVCGSPVKVSRAR